MRTYGALAAAACCSRSAAAVFGLLYLLSDGFRSETNRALGILGRGDIAGLRDYIVSFGLWAPVASCFLMVLQALVAPVPSFLITFANGLAFGVFWGWMLSLFGHVLAAAVCFGISRALGRVPVEVLVGKTGLESADRWFARWGVYAVFVGRLLPGVAFDAISYAAGLTRMRFRSFIAATALGIFPQTFLYSYLGRQAPEYVALFLVTSGLRGPRGSSGRRRQVQEGTAQAEKEPALAKRALWTATRWVE